MSQRPWVGATGFEIPAPVAQQRLLWRAAYKNFGQSPALEVRVKDTVQLIDRDVIFYPLTKRELDSLWRTLKDASFSSILFSGGVPMTVMTALNQEPNSAQVEALEAHKMSLVYLTEIAYRDIFGDSHVTRTCQVWSKIAEQGGASCGVGDSAD